MNHQNSSGGSGSGGSTTNYVWKAACNPDGSDLSDTEHAEWVFSDGQEGTMIFEEDHGWVFRDHSIFGSVEEDRTLTIIEDRDNPGIFAYRKYTPGHWEDADGNWVQGEWQKTPDEYTPEGCEWNHNGEGFPYLVWDDENSIWTNTGSPVNNEDVMMYKSINDKYANLYIRRETNWICIRTWTTTVPAPTE